MIEVTKSPFSSRSVFEVVLTLSLLQATDDTNILAVATMNRVNAILR
jgi:hypothetical protein